jgi:hypothetical protein
MTKCCNCNKRIPDDREYEYPICRPCISTAYHEAGHAIIAAHFGEEVHRVTLFHSESDNGSLGNCTIGDGAFLRRLKNFGKLGEVITPKRKARAENCICADLAGVIAERRLNGGRLPKNWYKQPDVERAFDIAYQIAFEHDNDEAYAYMHYLYVRTRVMIDDPGIWGDIGSVAAMLMVEGSISGENIYKYWVGVSKGIEKPYVIQPCGVKDAWR